jgi:hypothetical protein
MDALTGEIRPLRLKNRRWAQKCFHKCGVSGKKQLLEVG